MDVGGYEPELKRTLGSFQVFAVSFAFISVAVLIFGGGVVLMIALPGNALLQLITSGTILPVILYGATVVLYLAVRKGLAAKEGAFSLGRLELPVAIGALAWLVVALLVLVVPHQSRVPVLIVVGLVLAGGLFFLLMLTFDHKSLEAKPSDESILAA